MLVIESIDGLRHHLRQVMSVQSSRKPQSGPCGFVYSATNYLLKIPSDLDFLTTRQEQRNSEKNGDTVEAVDINTFESSVQTSKLAASKRQKHPPSQPPSQKQRRREARQERERLAQAARVEARLKCTFGDVVGEWMGDGVGGEEGKGGKKGSIRRNPFVLRSSCSLVLHRYGVK